MEYNTSPISQSEYTELLKKSVFEFSEVQLLSKFISKPLESEFETQLSAEERAVTKNLVLKNINKIYQIFTTLINDPKKHDYLIDKTFLKMCHDQYGENGSQLIFFKAQYILSNGKLSEYSFDGKIPKKGLFSTRQTIADKWINHFVKLIGLGIVKEVFTRTNFNKELALYALTINVSCFLINTYPNYFKIEDKFEETFDKLSKY